MKLDKCVDLYKSANDYQKKKEKENETSVFCKEDHT